MAKVAPALLAEKGYEAQPTNGFWSYSWNDPEQTPELRWPQSIRIFDAMRHQDPQVASVLDAVTQPIMRTEWRIDGTGCRDVVTAHVAGDLGLPIAGLKDEEAPARTRDRFSWSEHLEWALLSLPFGHMVFEQVYRIGDDGLAHLRKLGPRFPRTIAAFNVAPDGGLISVEQWSGTGGRIVIPVSQLVVYTHKREGGNWAGTSLLRSAYKNWLLKDRVLRTQTQSIDRNGMGVPWYTGADGEKDLTAGKNIAKAARSGDNAGGAGPHGSQFELKGVMGALPDTMGPLRYHDESIARAVLAHFLNLGQAQGTGSYALGSSFLDFFTLGLQARAADVADVASAHIVEDLVDVNWGPDEPAPRIVFDEIGSRAQATGQAIALLVSSGVLTADQGLEAAMRDIYGLPGQAGPANPEPPPDTTTPTGGQSA